MKKITPCLLVILDGWGIGGKNSNNAVHIANTPFLDKLKKKYHKSKLNCFGLSVGLPNGVMGNSEVGHINIGAGRVVYQDLLKINESIKKGNFYKNKTIENTLNKALTHNSSVHIIGLLSDGGVHSHIDHLFSLIKFAKNKSVKKLNIHAILDGRDTPPNSGSNYLKKLQDYIYRIKSKATISSICGRYYSMDRDNRWERIEKAYNLYTKGIGKIVNNGINFVKSAYLSGISDEFMIPIIVNKDNQVKKRLIKNNDVVIFFNFRADRARELTYAFCRRNFVNFNRKCRVKLLDFLTMTSYDDSLDVSTIFSQSKIKNSLGEIVSKKKLIQLRIAETEKYAHVSYFFNGGIESFFLNEDRCLIPSPKDINTYNKKPEMNVYLVTDKLINFIKKNNYDFIVINLANMDMVGHTGVINSAVKACEAIDKCLSRIINILIKNDTITIITSDHGNCEKMLRKNKKPFTSHTTNRVPLFIISKKSNKKLIPHASLNNIAPTIADLLGIKRPTLMTGRSIYI